VPIETWRPELPPCPGRLANHVTPGTGATKSPAAHATFRGLAPAHGIDWMTGAEMSQAIPPAIPSTSAARLIGVLAVTGGTSGLMRATRCRSTTGRTSVRLTGSPVAVAALSTSDGVEFWASTPTGAPEHGPRLPGVRTGRALPEGAKLGRDVPAAPETASSGTFLTSRRDRLKVKWVRVDPGRS